MVPAAPMSSPLAQHKKAATPWTSGIQRVWQQTMPVPTIARKVPVIPANIEKIKKARLKWVFTSYITICITMYFLTHAVRSGLPDPVLDRPHFGPSNGWAMGHLKVNFTFNILLSKPVPVINIIWFIFHLQRPHNVKIPIRTFGAKQKLIKRGQSRR